MKNTTGLIACLLLIHGAAAGAQLHGQETLTETPRAAGLATTVHAATTLGLCIAGPNTLCLAQDRFSVEVTWTDFDDVSGEGTVLPFQSADSGLLWFFAADNWEMLVKVLFGCGFNDHFWVFSAASTDVEYRLRVTDHVAGVVKEYFNPLGNAAAAITDTFAFPTCDVVGGRPDLLLFADPATVPVLGTAALTVIARNSLGGPETGVQVSLESTLGTVEPVVVTDADGVARALFTAGAASGRATITAILEGAEPAIAEVAILDAADAELFVFANPATLPILGTTQITVIARDAAGIPVGAGRRVRLLADLGAIDEEIFTDDQGEARAVFTAASRSGVGRITALLHGSAPAHLEVEIRDAPDVLLLTSDRQTIDRVVQGAVVSFTANVRNPQGEPFAGAAVNFSSERGSFDQNVAFTDASGTATAVLTVRAIEVQDIPENGSFPVSAEATAQGQTRVDSVFLTVLGAP